MGTDFDLTHHRFTLNSSLWKKDKDAAVAEFDGQIISGTPRLVILCEGGMNNAPE